MHTKVLGLETSVSPLAFLIPLQGVAGGGPIQLQEFTTIGRDPGCALALRDDFVSARHARVERKAAGTWTVRDLGSRNGVYLNGARVIEAVLTANDKIRLGETVFVFSDSAAAPAAPLTSRSPAWNETLRRLPAFAVTEFPVLLGGPSGSGKDVLARWIHSASPRAAGPFVSINCGALSESLIESELFGHLRGSFTGAVNDRKGAFEAARGGVLFLDEIGDFPLALQPKLLRAIENSEIRPVGGDRAIETDVRVIAATHKNLADEARAGRFREDLYYRLCVCSVRAPALKDRMEDFDDLLYRFAKELRVRFSFGAIEALKKHAWPGNVRELRNAVARASAYYPGKHILPADVEQIVDRAALAPEMHYLAASDRSDGTGGQVIKEFEREMILRRLVANRGNQRRTAMELGLPKSTLHDRIRTYGINLDAIEAGLGRV